MAPDYDQRLDDWLSSIPPHRPPERASLLYRRCRFAIPMDWRTRSRVSSATWFARALPLFNEYCLPSWDDASPGIAPHALKPPPIRPVRRLVAVEVTAGAAKPGIVWVQRRSRLMEHPTWTP